MIGWIVTGTLGQRIFFFSGEKLIFAGPIKHITPISQYSLISSLSFKAFGSDSVLFPVGIFLEFSFEKELDSPNVGLKVNSSDWSFFVVLCLSSYDPPYRSAVDLKSGSRRFWRMCSDNILACLPTVYHPKTCYLSTKSKTGMHILMEGH